MPISAYKVADAIGKPVMATASGWVGLMAHANNNAVGLSGFGSLNIRTWSQTMAPHRKWAFTTEKGTHWYQSKPEDFAYLYNFHKNKQPFVLMTMNI